MSNPKFDNDMLSEQDFYPPSDNRVLKSHIEDIDGGDNFADYCRYIFKIIETDDENDYYDDYYRFISNLNKTGYFEDLVDE